MTYLFLHLIMHLLMFLSPDWLINSVIWVSLFYKFTRFLNFVSVSLWRRANAQNVKQYYIRIGSTPTFLYFNLHSLWLAMSDDYRMVCYRMGLRLSGTAGTAGLPLKEKIAFGSNNTGRNWTEFWFIVFKTWFFKKNFRGGGSWGT